MNFKNQVVIITGAAQGIGRALAIAYSREDSHTILLDKNEQQLYRTGEEIKAEGGKATPFILDLIDPHAIERVFSEIDSKMGRVDILINNAGLGINKPIFELKVEEWDYVMNTNLRAAFICSREVARIMKKNGKGSIVNIASTRALMSEPNTFPYSASKGGLLALTHSLAISLGPDNITVNSVSPGWIHTGEPGQLSQIDHEQHPASRVGKPDDIVKACFYLTDPENGFVTGANLVVDGGMTRKMIYLG